MPFEKDFTPVVMPDQYVKILPDYGFYKVLQVEPIGYLIKDFSVSIASESWSRGNELQEVYVLDDEMAQWRLKVLDDIEVIIAPLGKERKRGSLKYGSPVSAGKLVDTYNESENSTEFFSFEDEKIYIDIYNPTKYTITTERILLYGYKYKLEKMPTAPGKYTVIPIGVIV